MAKKTKAQKTQAAQESLKNALSDNKLTKDEIKAIKNADGGDAFKQYSTSLLDKIKAGDADTLKLLGASDLDFGTSIFNNKALKGTDYYQFGADILNKAAKDKPIDFSYSPERNKLAATLYQAAGDEKLVDPRWLAEANGQNTYKDKEGNYKLTSVGENAYNSGLGNAEDLAGYNKQFYADNFSKNFVNGDGSLTPEGQQAFNDFWQQSGISNRAKALEAFQQQVNPLYQSPTGTTPTNSDVNLPTSVGNMNEWAANNLVGTTTAPLSQQNLDALKSGEDVAKSNIDAGDKNAPIRDMLMNYAKSGGNLPDNPYFATANTIDPTQLAGSTAYTTNPYLADFQQLDMTKLMPADYAKSDVRYSDGAQIDPTKLNKAEAGVATASLSPDTQIDLGQYIKAGVTPTQIDRATAAQIDPNALRTMQADQFNNQKMANATLVDRNNNPYLNQTTAPIAFSETSKYAGMNNPYLQSVIDYATGDIARNFNNNVQNSTDAMMARSGAFGGSAWAAAQAENNRQYANELGRTVGGMRMSDFQTQQQLEEARIERQKQIAIQNQNTARLDLDRNAGLYSNMAIEDARNLTDVSKFNASEGNNIGLKNTEYRNNANKSNADSYNAALMENLRNLQNTAIENTRNTNQAYLKDSDNAYDASKNYANTYNLGLNKNADLLNNNRQFNATNLTDISNRNADRTTDVNKQYTNLLADFLKSNANLKQDNDQFNAGVYNTNSENNATRQNDSMRTYADTWNKWIAENTSIFNKNATNNTDILNKNAENNATRLTDATNKNADAWNGAMRYNTDTLNNTSKDNADTLYNYWNSANNNFMNAFSSIGNWMNDSRYNDISKLNDVGSSYRDYAQGLINENLANFNNKNSWAQNQNDKLGDTVNAAGGLNNTSTGNTTVPANNNMWGTIGGLLSVGGGLLGSWANQPSGGGGSGSINPNNTSIFNATNSWLPNYGWK